MSKATTQTNAEPLLDEAEVVDFLHKQPDFFKRHPDALAQLTVTHDSGSAASLIERQVDVLRTNNRQLQARLNELIDMARGNEQRVTQVNHLAQALIAATDVAELVQALVDCVKQEMSVDAVFIGLRGLAETAGDGDAIVHPLAEDTPADHAVTDVFRRGKPICGALSAQQAKTLFGGGTSPLASAAMVPLGTDGVHGALVLASTDSDYFVANMGTLFLDLMGELVTTGLRRHLGADVVH